MLLLLLLLEHVCLLGLKVREGMRIRTNARRHARHHGTGLANGAVWPGDSWVHLQALLHGVAGAWSSHHMALGHLHAGLLWEVRGLHHLVRRVVRPGSRSPRASSALSLWAKGKGGIQKGRCASSDKYGIYAGITAHTCPWESGWVGAGARGRSPIAMPRANYTANACQKSSSCLQSQNGGAGTGRPSLCTCRSGRDGRDGRGGRRPDGAGGG